MAEAYWLQLKTETEANMLPASHTPSASILAPADVGVESCTN